MIPAGPVLESMKNMPDHAFTRQLFWRVVRLAVVCVFTFVGRGAAGAENRSNVLFIAVDGFKLRVVLFQFDFLP